MPYDYDLTDEELLFILKDDYHFAFEILFKRYKGLIRFWVDKYVTRYPLLIRQDAFQIALIAFYKAINHYVAGTTRFINYAKKGIHQSILSELRYQIKHRAAYSLDDTIDDEGDLSYVDLVPSATDFYEPRHYMMVRETADKAAEAFSSLTKKQQQIWQMFCEGLTHRQIAEQLDVDERHVEYHLKVIRDRFKEKVCW